MIKIGQTSILSGSISTSDILSTSFSNITRLTFFSAIPLFTSSFLDCDFGLRTSEGAHSKYKGESLHRIEGKASQ